MRRRLLPLEQGKGSRRKELEESEGLEEASGTGESVD